LSSSIIPGSGPIMKMLGKTPEAGQPSSKAQQAGASITKFGLPVEAKSFSHHCQKIVKVGFNALIGLTGMAPTGKVMDIFKGLIGNAIEFRYCNKISGIDPGWDAFWGEDGAMVVYGGSGGNGGPYFQTWALNINPQLTDTSEKKVAIGAQQYGNGEKNAGPARKAIPIITALTGVSLPGMYMSQAEFYFDCDDVWGLGPSCSYEDNATYQIKWRARLRRLQAPAVASGIFSTAFSMLLNLPAYKDFKDKLAAKGGPGTFTESQLKAIIGRIEAELGIVIGGAGGGLAGKLNPSIGGIYH
jgi:hypothetical protein